MYRLSRGHISAAMGDGSTAPLVRLTSGVSSTRVRGYRTMYRGGNGGYGEERAETCKYK